MIETKKLRSLRIPLRARLSAGFVAVALLGGLVAGVMVDRNVQRTTRGSFEDRLSYEATMLGQMTANALFGDLDPADTSLNAPVHALGDAVHTQLAVIAKDGTVVADSAVDDPHAMGSQGELPEIVAARAGGEGRAIHDGRLYVARSIVRDGVTLGFARSSVPMSEVDAYVAGVRTQLAWGSGISMLAAVILGLLLSSRIVRPVKKLAEGARRVGGGDFEHTIAVASNDEIGDLAVSFNEMTGNLRHTMQVLDGRNRDMRLVLDNVDQGLLTLDRGGVVSDERSAAVDRWLGATSPGSRFGEILSRFDPKLGPDFEAQWEDVVEGVLPLALAVDQLPKKALRGQEQLEISYTPIRDSGGLSKMLVVISDVTARRAAERAEAEQREVACIFEHMMRDKAGVLELLLDAETQVRALTGDTRPPLVETRRRLHTLKGNAAIYGMQRLSSLCHDIETRMAEADLTTEDREALAVAWRQMSERLSAFVGDAKQVVIDDEEYRAVLKAVFDGTPRAQLARMVGDWHMEKATDRLARFAASARDLGARLGKGVVVVDVQRSTVRLPRERWAPFWGAFTHVVRNAVDHGLESEADRKQAGKSAPAQIRLGVWQRGDEIVVEASDNGRGIDWERVAERARRLGMPASAHEDLVHAIFADGVSTRDDVTDTSGRGVGLAAVRAACEGMGGHVRVDSSVNRGTTFSFHVPVAPRGSSLPPIASRWPGVSAAG